MEVQADLFDILDAPERISSTSCRSGLAAHPLPCLAIAWPGRALALPSLVSPWLRPWLRLCLSSWPTLSPLSVSIGNHNLTIFCLFLASVFGAWESWDADSLQSPGPQFRMQQITTMLLLIATDRCDEFRFTGGGVACFSMMQMSSWCHDDFALHYKFAIGMMWLKVWNSVSRSIVFRNLHVRLKGPDQRITKRLSKFKTCASRMEATAATPFEVSPLRDIIL